MRLGSVLVALSVLLALPASGEAKNRGAGVRFCGIAACRTIFDVDALSPIGTAMYGTSGHASTPARPERFYRLTWADQRGRTISVWSPVYYVPVGQVLRVDQAEGATWVSTDGLEKSLADATRGLEPFPKPRVVRAEVGGGRARHPTSYLLLYELVARGQRVPDPLGTRPALEWRNYEALVRYYRRDRRLWIPIRLYSRSPSPWTDAAAQLSVGRHHALLRGDGSVVRIPRAAAADVRRGASLRN